VDEAGNPLPTFEYRGQTYVLGVLGQRYLLRVRNHSGQRIEVVASVDGRDVIDGRPAAWSKRGYVIDPYSEASIDGYRLNEQSVAAFRFSSVPRSYSAQMGDARDVGVIGVAVFTEQQPIYYYYPRPYPSRRAPMEDSGRSKSGSLEGGVEGGVVGGAPDVTEPAAPPSSPEAKLSQRPGLGTEFAEQHTSQVYSVHFERASSTPATVLTMRYNDRAGLLALGIDVDHYGWYSRSDVHLRETAEPFRQNATFSQPPVGWRP
jgi:hypothetical protein